MKTLLVDYPVVVWRATCGTTLFAGTPFLFEQACGAGGRVVDVDDTQHDQNSLRTQNR